MAASPAAQYHLRQSNLFRVRPLLQGALKLKVRSPALKPVL